ncbi:MAG: ABC transporter ATP-binding protein [Acidobacteriota bacterium]
MEKDVLIRVESTSKKYCRSLKRSMIYGISDICRNAVGMSSKSHKLRKNEFWALDNISFELKKGEVLGIIGPNGSGKSTLLKLLNGIFWPDKGQISIIGRVGALIEVGAGFHPLLTGKENIFLNGAILGMTKDEIRNKFDDIVNFSGIGEFLDTPVKHYSSGMFVRLGFSIAAHCEPDVLLVDEILSVGDINFQAKSKKKIMELLDKGTAIVLVSHNLNLINNLCKKTVLINKSSPCILGKTSDIIEKYREIVWGNNKNFENYGTGDITIGSIDVLNNEFRKSYDFRKDEQIILKFNYHAENEIEDPVFTLGIFNDDGIQVTGIRTDNDKIMTGTFYGRGSFDLIIEKNFLLPGIYSISANVYEKRGIAFYNRVINISEFKISGSKGVFGYIDIPHKWNFK